MAVLTYAESNHYTIDESKAKDIWKIYLTVQSVLSSVILSGVGIYVVYSFLPSVVQIVFGTTKGTVSFTRVQFFQTTGVQSSFSDNTYNNSEKICTQQVLAVDRYWNIMTISEGTFLPYLSIIHLDTQLS